MHGTDIFDVEHNTYRPIFILIYLYSTITNSRQYAMGSKEVFHSGTDQSQMR